MAFVMLVGDDSVFYFCARQTKIREEEDAVGGERMRRENTRARSTIYTLPQVSGPQHTITLELYAHFDFQAFLRDLAHVDWGRCLGKHLWWGPRWR